MSGPAFLASRVMPDPLIQMLERDALAMRILPIDFWITLDKQFDEVLDDFRF